MKNKYYIIGIVIALILIGLYYTLPYILLSLPPVPIDRVNPDIPENFLYQSKSDEIPEEYLIVANEILDTDLIYEENNKFYCKPSGSPAVEIEYYYYSPGAYIMGGWYYRSAFVCGDYYWIVDGADRFGQRVYGPFEL